MKLLVIEDDNKTVSLLQRGLTEEGFVVDCCGNGEDGLHFVLTGYYDLIVLDVMLPRLDGWSVLTQMRRQDCHKPVLMLTARESVEDRVKGLTLGADDYLIKPFAFTELLARIRSVLRRGSAPASDILQFEDLKLDLRRHKTIRGGVSIELSNREILLLELLLRRQGEVLSRTCIEEQVWDMAFDSDSNIVDVYIRRLRSKIDDPFSRKLINTVRGRGYVLR